MARWWWFVAMPLSMLGFWALLAWVAVTVEGDKRTTPPAAASTDAERILAERYARGDIDTTEYHARLDDLRQTTDAHERRRSVNDSDYGLWGLVILNTVIFGLFAPTPTVIQRAALRWRQHRACRDVGAGVDDDERSPTAEAS